MTASPARSDISIVGLQPQHAPALHELETVCFSSPWSEADIAALCSDPRAVCFVALCDGKPVGYAGMYTVLDEGMINNVAVDPAFRRRRIASELLSALIRHAEEHGVKELTLEVRHSNEAAVRLYEKEGFVPVGVRRNYYVDPREDALLYKKEIKCSILQ